MKEPFTTTTVSECPSPTFALRPNAETCESYREQEQARSLDVWPFPLDSSLSCALQKRTGSYRRRTWLAQTEVFTQYLVEQFCCLRSVHSLRKAIQ